MKKSILILSGGLDSTVACYLSRDHAEPILALTFDYGQKAAVQEKKAARKIADCLGVDHHLHSLPWLKELTKTSLVNPDAELPKLNASQLDDPKQTAKSAMEVWVPNRNGLFLSIAATYAESLGADFLVTGFNIEEGKTFPDNSAPFVETINQSFSFSTQNKVQVLSPTLKMTKKEIALKAKELGVSIEDIWFCYEGGKSPCRQCESCLRGFRALREVGIG